MPFYYANGVLDAVTARKAVAEFGRPVLLLAGEYDVAPPPNAAEHAGLFELAVLAVSPGAGHFPWLDDPAWFTGTLAAIVS